MTVNVGRGMHNLGAVATRMGDHAVALDRYRAALEVLLKVGDRNLIALNLMSTGDALVRLERPPRRACRSSRRCAWPSATATCCRRWTRTSFSARRARAGRAREPRSTHRHGDRRRSEHRFANVLADALIACARAIVTLAPAEALSAWRGATRSRASGRPHWCAAMPRSCWPRTARELQAGRSARLEEIAREARALLARVSASPATRSAARHPHELPLGMIVAPSDS
jgi:hypothetical protein